MGRGKENIFGGTLSCTIAAVALTLAVAGAMWLLPGRVESGDKSRRERREAQRRECADTAGKETATRELEPGTPASARLTLRDAIRFVQERQPALRGLVDYTAVFTKIELIDQRTTRRKMDMKFRSEPFSVYFECYSKLDPPREVIYVAGANDGYLLLHEAGLKAIIGTVMLKPDDARIMEENRYPITDAGLAKMVDILLAIWEQEKDIDADQVDVKFLADETVGGVECDGVEVTHPQKVPGLKFHSTRVFFNRQTKLPVQLEQFDWPEKAGEKPPIVEKYNYADVKANVGLTDADFDPRNPEYQFAAGRQAQGE
jgi:hypothetical protein